MTRSLYHRKPTATVGGPSKAQEPMPTKPTLAPTLCCANAMLNYQCSTSISALCCCLCSAKGKKGVSLVCLMSDREITSGK
ncbi:hypothetical protein BAUCODRAFT_302039 [Baudoinia panamericana UAMH 10762]|uniref:Uncharacterized protein n=1 Tax=Baudoinia panamericana (strain UAMH 10762) TaxID=717646 RepID=M2MZF7_BAUPA|nr:uncharacterized protein BAUCODRAFT_302039 [Baudoinia panamericana UAMH 10762]EMC91720.1 hypothetical protein BAUCODRAFT_302039 [Baudoinia panamericana UAMH 10762]